MKSLLGKKKRKRREESGAKRDRRIQDWWLNKCSSLRTLSIHLDLSVPCQGCSRTSRYDHAAGCEIQLRARSQRSIPSLLLGPSRAGLSFLRLLSKVLGSNFVDGKGRRWGGGRALTTSGVVGRQPRRECNKLTGEMGVSACFMHPGLPAWRFHGRVMVLLSDMVFFFPRGPLSLIWTP
ncbi:hypothetical protein LY78DRAFT_282240 [Colletotrichum sublineola]|nr:hypothetical protein LY78DRAFT_282240 [Colletotrichum sublineola]